MARAHLRLIRAAALVTLAGGCAAFVGCASQDKADGQDLADAQRSALTDGRLPGIGFSLDPTLAVRSPEVELRGTDRQLAERQRIAPQDVTPARPGGQGGPTSRLARSRSSATSEVTLNFKAAPCRRCCADLRERPQVDYAISPRSRTGDVLPVEAGSATRSCSDIDSVLRMYGGHAGQRRAGAGAADRAGRRVRQARWCAGLRDRRRPDTARRTCCPCRTWTGGREADSRAY